MVLSFRPLYGVPNFYVEAGFYTSDDIVFVPSTGFLISTKLSKFERWCMDSFRPLYGVPNFYYVYTNDTMYTIVFVPSTGFLISTRKTIWWLKECLTVFVPSTGFLISTLSLIALGKSILFIWFAGQTRKPDIFLSIKFHFLLKMPILQVSAQNYIFWYSILPIPMS